MFLNLNSFTPSTIAPAQLAPGTPRSPAHPRACPAVTPPLRAPSAAPEQGMDGGSGQKHSHSTQARRMRPATMSSPPSPIERPGPSPPGPPGPPPGPVGMVPVCQLAGLGSVHLIFFRKSMGFSKKPYLLSEPQGHLYSSSRRPLQGMLPEALRIPLTPASGSSRVTRTGMI